MENKTITIYDIAKEARVSPSSVSRVLNQHPNVSEKMRTQVMSVVDRHQFMPNIMAQGLEKGKSKTIGIVMPAVSNPYYATVFSAANATAIDSGYSTWLYQAPGNRFSGETPGNRLIGDKVINQLIHRRLEGVLCVGGFLEKDEIMLVNTISTLRKYMPVVTICTPFPDMNCACFYNDFDNGIKRSVIHLHNLGHNRIAFLGGSHYALTSGMRGKAFLNALAELGLTDDPTYHNEGGYTSDSGARTILKLLSNMEKRRWPTALICFNDLVALGAIKQLRTMGVRVPEDMAIIGCDNIFFAPYILPPLTTLDLYPYEMGRIGMQELLSNKANNAKPFCQVQDCDLVIRESCGVKLGRRQFG